jgi:HD superfamily phosphodiesterase
MLTLTDKQMAQFANYVHGYLLHTANNYGHLNATRRAEMRWMHTLNVLKNCELILEGEGADYYPQQVCRVAALFHDIDHYTVDLPYHGQRGAETTLKYLTKEGYPADFASRVAEAVRTHHQDYDDDDPITQQVAAIAAKLGKEAQIVMDAETLDKIGASNILQSVITLCSKPKLTGDLAHDLTAGFPLQRALNWQATLVTATGKRLGQQRLAFYEQFLQQVRQEVVMVDPYPKAGKSNAS